MTDEHARLSALARHSVEVIRENQAPSGAYLASPTFPVYRYSWFRDGAFIADAMSRAGHPDSSERFFGWCTRVLVARASTIDQLIARRAAGAPIAASEFLHARYAPDGADSHEEWWTFQLDGYGTWLWALGDHVTRHGGSIEPYVRGVELSVRYLIEFWNEPCFDWWEENLGHRHTSTLAAVHAGLAMAAGRDELDADLRQAAGRTAAAIRDAVLDEGVRDGRLTKWLGGDALDASLVACATPFHMFDGTGALMEATIAALEARLAHGGVHRYEADTYYGGGEWLLLAAFLGWHYAEVGRMDDSWAQLRWVAAQATPAGDLPEQVPGHLLQPLTYDQWVARWGPIATPLLWSHAMYLVLAIRLGAIEVPVVDGTSLGDPGLATAVITLHDPRRGGQPT